MGPYTLPSESPSPTGKFKNIELLRFLMAWAIVGAHIVYGQGFVQFGLGFLEPYLYKGSNAVPMFFVIAFFFLSLKTKPEQPFFFFIVSKWLRLAPLVIAVTVVAYILHLFSFWGWSHELNIGNILLIQDWSVWPRWRYFVHPAWYCHAYLLLAIFYLGLIKAFDQKYVFFVLGVCAYIGWRIFGLMSVLPEYGSLLGHYDIGRGLFCLGLATLLTHLHKIYPPLPPKHTICYTALELVLFGGVFGNLFFGKWNVLTSLHIILAFSLLFYLFIQRKGLLSRFLEKDWCVLLGRYAFGIFIVHALVLSAAQRIVLPHYKSQALEHPWLVLAGIVATTLILAITGYHFVEVPIARWSIRFKRRRIFV